MRDKRERQREIEKESKRELKRGEREVGKGGKCRRSEIGGEEE